MSALLRFQVAPVMAALPRGLRRTFDALTYCAPRGIVAGEVFDWCPAEVSGRAAKSQRQVRSDMAALEALQWIGRQGGRVTVHLRPGFAVLRKVKRRLSPTWAQLIGSAAAVLRQFRGSFGGVSPSKQSENPVRESEKKKGPFVGPVSDDEKAAAMARLLERHAGEALEAFCLRLRSESIAAASRQGFA